MPDMIAARQELDLRPQLERLDRLMLRSEGLDPDGLSFAFRPLWQLDAASAAAIALQKAQATQIYAGLGLWPAAVMARLVEAQLAQDGTYPNAEAVFAQDPGPPGGPIFDYDPNQRRGPDGEWIETGAVEAPPETSASPEPDGHRRIVMAPARQEPHPAFDPVLGPILRQAALPLAPLAAMASIRRRAAQIAQGLVGNLVRNLSAWLPIGPPKDPTPPASVAGSGTGGAASPSLPRPLTIQGGTRQTDPSDHGYSFSEEVGGSAAAGSPGRTLDAIEVPTGLTLQAQGKTAKERGDFYAEEVRKSLHFEPAPRLNTEGSRVPDGLMVDSNDQEIALEVKYLSRYKGGLRDPERTLKFVDIDGNDIAQARKYLDEFKGGLLWVVNDQRLVVRYGEMFRNAGLSGFRIICIPSR